ncbi:5-bromo-4-chloroindolyl phosphate hydrolysis family protein [Sulfitobacter sp.]|uniref:5-bromo-4-chloroindolyl phosphate hydrolysis family protein n=1 Tax=Sulfitobacter sp. TaxID=1903071 RepID=UPI003299A9DD
MAKRFGGKFSPESNTETGSSRRRQVSVDPVGGRANVLFLPALVLVATNIADPALELLIALVGAAALTLAAWLMRGGLRAEAAYNARKVARRPAFPRKIVASVVGGIGAMMAVMSDIATVPTLSPLLYGIIAGGLYLVAFGPDPLQSKGMDGVDTFQQDRVARVVDEAERHLTTMRETILRAGDRQSAARLEDFVDTARELIRTVEEDPRDLTATRKYLGVYLQGARDATAKFSDIYARNQDVQARADYLALLDDLEKNFAARNRKSLLDDRSDLNVEIDVLRERLSREGLRLD